MNAELTSVAFGNPYLADFHAFPTKWILQFRAYAWLRLRHPAALHVTPSGLNARAANGLASDPHLCREFRAAEASAPHLALPEFRSSTAVQGVNRKAIQEAPLSRNADSDGAVGVAA